MTDLVYLDSLAGYNQTMAMGRSPVWPLTPLGTVYNLPAISPGSNALTETAVDIHVFYCLCLMATRTNYC